MAMAGCSVNAVRNIGVCMALLDFFSSVMAAHCSNTVRRGYITVIPGAFQVAHVIRTKLFSKQQSVKR